MKVLLALSLVLLTTGCATNPWVPASLVTDGLVSLEDRCEDPVVDAQTYTFNEGLADLAATPYNLAMILGRTVAIFAVGIPMIALGYDQQTINGHLDWLFPLYRAGPDPDKVRYHDHMIDPAYRPCADNRVKQARNGP